MKWIYFQNTVHIYSSSPQKPDNFPKPSLFFDFLSSVFFSTILYSLCASRFYFLVSKSVFFFSFKLSPFLHLFFNPSNLSLHSLWTLFFHSGSCKSGSQVSANAGWRPEEHGQVVQDCGSAGERCL